MLRSIETLCILRILRILSSFQMGWIAWILCTVEIVRSIGNGISRCIVCFGLAGDILILVFFFRNVCERKISQVIQDSFLRIYR